MSKDKPAPPPPPPEPPPPPPPVQEPDPGDVAGKKRRQAMPASAIIATILSKAMGGGKETLG